MDEIPVPESTNLNPTFKLVPKVVKIADKHTDSATWSGEQALSELLEEIRAKRINPSNMMILWFEEMPDGRHSVGRWFVNTDPRIQLAMIALAQQKALEDWKA